MAAFHAVFGDPIDKTRWDAADPLLLAARADPKAAPALYFDCGAEDRYGLAAGQKKLQAALTARQVPYTAELPPGDHGYEFVRSRLEVSLRFLDRALGDGRERRPMTAPVSLPSCRAGGASPAARCRRARRFSISTNTLKAMAK